MARGACLNGGLRVARGSKPYALVFEMMSALAGAVLMLHADEGMRHRNNALPEASLQLAEHPDESHGQSTDGGHKEERKMGDVEGHEHMLGLANRNSQLTNQPP